MHVVEIYLSVNTELLQGGWAVKVHSKLTESVVYMTAFREKPLYLWKYWSSDKGIVREGLLHRNYRISRPIRRTVIFSLEILEKNNECILILVVYWKKTGLLHTKISNHNIIYSSYKPRKSSSLPLKSSSWLFSLSHDKDVW